MVHLCSSCNFLVVSGRLSLVSAGGWGRDHKDMIRIRGFNNILYRLVDWIQGGKGDRPENLRLCAQFETFSYNLEMEGVYEAT